MKNTPEVQRLDWLEKSLPGAIKALQLVKSGKVSAKVLGFFIRTVALRLLRCVYGSDLAASVAIREHALETAALRQKLDSMTPAQVEAYFAEMDTTEKEKKQNAV